MPPKKAAKKPGRPPMFVEGSAELKAVQEAEKKLKAKAVKPKAKAKGKSKAKGKAKAKGKSKAKAKSLKLSVLEIVERVLAELERKDPNIYYGYIEEQGFDEVTREGFIEISTADDNLRGNIHEEYLEAIEEALKDHDVGIADELIDYHTFITIHYTGASPKKVSTKATSKKAKVSKSNMDLSNEILYILHTLEGNVEYGQETGFGHIDLKKVLSQLKDINELF